MRHNFQRTCLAVLLATMPLWSPARAADTAESIIAKAQAEADRAEAKVAAEIAKAEDEIRRAEAAIERGEDVDDVNHDVNHEPAPGTTTHETRS